MKEKFQAFFMWLLAAPVTAAGIDAMVHTTTAIIGALTALVGLLIGICGLIWWIRRLRRQTIKITREELDFQRMRDRLKKQTHKHHE